ncbi:MAG: ABC transporter substrate-binding protein, partial [Thermomicrobiales bacterium]
AGVAGLAVAGLGAISRAAAQDATPAAAVKMGGVLKMGMQADPTGLDAQKQSLTALWHTVEHIYNRLTGVNPDLTIKPELAASWTISPDGVTYTFKLVPGVKFHDGTPLKASDVKFSFERLIDPATAATDASDLASMKSVAAPDDGTVVVTLKAPDASFLVSISNQSCIVMAEAFVKANNNDISQVAIGTGPFKFKEYVPNTQVTLVKNKEYWEKGLPYLDGLNLIIAAEDTSRTTAVTTGTVDFIEYAPLRDITEILEKDSSLMLAGDTNQNIRFMAFNMRKAPFDNLKVRQAISMVIDREAVLAPAVFGHGTPTETVFLASFWPGLKKDITPPNVEAAKALMAEAGFKDGFKTKITSWSQYSFLNAAAVVIQEQLKQIGIDAELNLVENATMIEQVYQKYEYELAVTGTSAFVDPNTVVLNGFKTGESGNFAGYSNPDVDKLIDQGIAETDQAKRAEIYQRMQQILLTDLPWINLFVANQYEAMKKYVMNYTHIPTGSNVSVKEVWLDK